MQKSALSSSLGQTSRDEIVSKQILGSKDNDSQQENEVSYQERDDLSPTAGQTWRRALRIVKTPLSRPVMVRVLFSVADL